MLLLISQIALATTYRVELAIPSQHGSHDGSIATSANDGAARALILTEQSDTTVNSTDSRVKCHIREGWLSVEFLATNSTWPSSFPVTATCTSGSDTLAISVVAMSSSADPSLQSGSISGSTVTATKVTGSSWLRAYRLPTDTWQTGLVGNSLNGVGCDVRAIPGESGEYMVRVVSAASAQTGTGTCALPRTGKANWTLTTALSAASI